MMRTSVFVVALIVGAQAGCEWYKNCGGCVADSGCGWCSNDPVGVGTGSVHSKPTQDGKNLNGFTNTGSATALSGSRSDTKADNGLSAKDVVGVRGSYTEVSAAQSSTEVTLANTIELAGSGMVASPYFGKTWGGSERNHHVVGVHKTKFTTEVKAGHHIIPYGQGSYAISSVNSDTMMTTTTAFTTGFTAQEYQIGNYVCSGQISYPDTSKGDVYGSYSPNPSKFASELQTGFVIACVGSGCGDVDSSGNAFVRVELVYHDQHFKISTRFQTAFADQAFRVMVGPRATGLISATAGGTRVEGSDPCRTTNNEDCHANTRFLTEVRVDDTLSINPNMTCTAGTTSSTCEYKCVVAEVADDSHLKCASALHGNIATSSKFKINSMHASAFTVAKYAQGGLSYPGGTSTTVTGYNSSKFTQVLGEQYAVIAKIQDSYDSRGYHFEKRTVTKVTSESSFEIDSPFSRSFGIAEGDPNAQDTYNYESCPSLVYENFDQRTENGHGVVSSDGTNHVYDNVQYSKVTTPSISSEPKLATAARFTQQLRVGYHIVVNAIERTVTKVVNDELIHINKAFLEGTAFNRYAFTYKTRKTGDHFLHWKPSASKGAYHSSYEAVALDMDLYSRNLMAVQTSDGTDIAASTRAGSNNGLQHKYLLSAPICYNNGRCVPKTSHSLVGVESAEHSAYVLSSALPHQTDVTNMVQVSMASGFSHTGTDNYFYDCKPKCTTVVCDTSHADSSNHRCETRAVASKVNSTHFMTEQVFQGISASATTAHTARVRYVTGTGTVSAQTGNTVTGASKETKTKFSSETASLWTITIGCGGATCAGTACTTDSDCMDNGKTTGGKCTASVCTGETVNITSVQHDTELVTSQAFANDYTKVDYTIGNINGLGLVTSSQNSKHVDGNTNTRFMEQLKVGYQMHFGSQTRTITSITSNTQMTVDSAFQTPGIIAASAYKFSGKKGTGEVSVNTATNAKLVTGTNDVTQTLFLNELQVGYLFMVGNDYKVITGITSQTSLTVDTAFTKTASTGYVNNDYNYESCWLSMGNESNVILSQQNAAYTNKKVYVEDACEIKPGCCGFKISSQVWPDKFAHYFMRPLHTNMVIRVVVTTTEDNVDVLAKKGSVPTTSSYDYKSVRESNPWALTVPSTSITCPGGTSFEGESNSHPPANCDKWYISVRGDNRYPQKTGASEYDLTVYTEFHFSNFICSDAHSDAGTNKCKWLGITHVEDANMATNDNSQAVMRLTPNTNQRKGAIHHATKVHLYESFELTVSFAITGYTVGCNSVLYPSGFCGGGDGFALVIQSQSDTQIGCTGNALGYANAESVKQGDDASRHRCTVIDSDPQNTCDTNDDGVFGETCQTGSLCTNGATKNGGCGTTGTCGFQSCSTGINKVLAIEFDTWNNLKLHDPKQGVSRWWINATEFVGYNDNHVAIFSSNAGIESDHSLNEHFAATPSIPNLADGKNHTVKVKYHGSTTLFATGSDSGPFERINRKGRGATHTANIQPCGDCEDTNTPTKFPAPDDCFKCRIQNTMPGTMSIFIDDMKRPVLQTKVSLRKSDSNDGTSLCADSDNDRCVLDVLGNAYVGFTAATGGERCQGRDDAGVHSTAAPTAGSEVACENAQKMLGAAQNQDILSVVFCQKIGCVPI